LDALFCADLRVSVVFPLGRPLSGKPSSPGHPLYTVPLLSLPHPPKKEHAPDDDLVGLSIIFRGTVHRVWFKTLDCKSLLLC
jgi:hypothetical protein